MSAEVQSSFVDVMERLRRGENDAATEVFRRYAGRLLALARSRLNPLLRRKADPDDVLQSAFKSFFHLVADGVFELRDWDSLWGLLVTMAVRKCHRQARHYHGAKRDLRREQAVTTTADSSQGDIELAGAEPTPEEAAAVADTLEELMRDLEDRDRLILQLRLQGHTAAEIGDLAGYTQFTIEGVLKKIRKRWKKLRDQE